MQTRISLKLLKIGQRGRVYEIDQCTYRPRLIEMGIIKGTDLTVLHRGPFNGPLAIRTGNHSLALRLEECDNIIVEI